jgi:phospholipase A1/A2
MMYRVFLLIFHIVSSLQFLDAQSISRDSAGQILLSTPAFSNFKDNYFIVGVPIGMQPDENNSNVKFQISFKQRLTNAVLPFQSYLYLTYSQKSIWRIFAYSSPFAESNYNPALGIGKVIFHKNQFRGLAAIAFEHESNGRDGNLSRSWNKITANYLLPLSHQSAVHLQAWLPFGVAVENADLMQYIGYGEASFHYVSPKKWLSFDITGRKGWAWDGRGSIEAQMNIRLSKKANQYLGIQWFKGFAETLVVYNRPIHMIRAGLMIKPPHFFAW